MNRTLWCQVQGNEAPNQCKNSFQTAPCKTPQLTTLEPQWDRHWSRPKRGFQWKASVSQRLRQPTCLLPHLLHKATCMLIMPVPSTVHCSKLLLVTRNTYSTIMYNSSHLSEAKQCIQHTKLWHKPLLCMALVRAVPIAHLADAGSGERCFPWLLWPLVRPHPRTSLLWSRLSTTQQQRSPAWYLNELLSYLKRSHENIVVLVHWFIISVGVIGS